MKKLSHLGIIAVSLTFAMFATSCQKQQDSAVTDPANSDAAVIKTVAGNGDWNGKISKEDALEMYNTFKKSAGAGNTESVQFSIKDVITYLNYLQAKYKSDKVYVNFAVYDQKTAPKPEYVGRETIFFSGNNNKTAPTGKLEGDGLLVLDGLDYLNHGNIYP